MNLKSTMKRRPVVKWLLACLLLWSSQPLLADEIRPAYLQLTEQQPNRFTVTWKVPARGDQQRLSLQVNFKADGLSQQEPVEGFVSGYHLRRWSLTLPSGLPGTMVAIDGLAPTSTEVLMRIEYQDGASLTHRFTPSSVQYVVPQKAGLLQTAWSYLGLGVEHILLGFDHLLFVFALLLLIDGTRKLIVTVTFFTLAHSITLTLASLQWIHVPVPPVEAIIALSIVFVAAEIIRVQQGHRGLAYDKPWVVAFSFGLLHGLGFAAALEAIGLPGNAIPTALVFFNVGVEIGQVGFIASVLAVGWLLQHSPLQSALLWKRGPAYVIGSLAAFWTIERTIGFWP